MHILNKFFVSWILFCNSFSRCNNETHSFLNNCLIDCLIRCNTRDCEYADARQTFPYKRFSGISDPVAIKLTHKVDLYVNRPQKLHLLGPSRDKKKSYRLYTSYFADNHTKISDVRLPYPFLSWWRHQVEKISALLALRAGNSQVTGEFPSQRPVTRSFDVFFGLSLNKRLSKQWCGWWFEMRSCSSWRHRNVIFPYQAF